MLQTILLNLSESLGNFQDLSTLLLRFSLDLIITFLIVKVVYRPTKNSASYQFTFYTFNILIFFVCYLMTSVKLDIGFAFGLFALFSIIRYRTDSIEITEMTYLFAIICIAVVNSISNNNMSVVELVLINIIILISMLVIDRAFFGEKLMMQRIQYEKIDLIKPEVRDKMLEDLRNRTGYDVVKVDVININFLNDTAEVKIYYRMP